MEGNEYIGSIGLLRDALITNKLALPTDIIGCSSEEINNVIAAAGKVTLPDDYIAFLRVMGHRAGTYLAGTDIFFPGLLETPEAVADIARQSGQNLQTENRFFFGHHQGYKVYFFTEDSHAVYVYQERQPAAGCLSATFSNFLWETLKRIIDIRRETRLLSES